MPRPLNSDCANNWRDTANDIREIQTRIESLTRALFRVTVENDCVPNELAAIVETLNALRTAEDSLNGLAYRCTPQTEWTGGAGSVVRAPHIVTQNR
jgi:hypothetical protein